MSKMLIDVAYSLGVQANKSGKLAIPCLDKNLLDNCLQGCKVGEGMPYMESWISGWHDSNLGKH